MAEQTPSPSVSSSGSAAEREAILNLQFRTGVMAHHLAKESDGRVSASPVPERTLQAWARADVEDFGKVREGRQDQVLPVMSNNMRTNDTYRATLEAEAPDVAAKLKTYDRETQAQFDAAMPSSGPKPAAQSLPPSAVETQAVERINDRQHLMTEAMHTGSRMSPEALAKFAQADAKDFANVSDGNREAMSIAVNIQALGERYPEYKAALASASPDTVKRIETLQAIDDELAGRRQAAPSTLTREQEIRVAVLGERQGAQGAPVTSLNQPPTGAAVDHFRLDAPELDMSSRHMRASEAVELADKIGHRGFTAVHTDGSMQVIGKVDGTWMRSDGKLLDDITAERDRDLLRKIEARSSNAGALNQSAAEADAVSFRSIDGIPARESAAVQMTDHGFDSPAYRETLSRTTAAREVAELNAVNDAKIAAKDDRKNAEFANDFERTLRERGETARAWDANEARSQAMQAIKSYAAETDPDERAFRLMDMQVDARANRHYRALAESAVPELKQQLAGEEARQAASTGVELRSMQGHRAVYNEEAGQAGAEVVRPDGTRIAFGGRPALERFAAENKLSEDDARTLRTLDARADVYRSAPAYPELRADRAAANDANSIELNTERTQQALPAADDAKRSAWLKKGAEATPAPAAPPPAPKPEGNKVLPDEVFKPADEVTRPIPSDIQKQYVRVGDNYYRPADRARTEPAFEDKGNKLQTKSDRETISDSLVRIAHARGWDDIKVSGSEQFRRQAWIEAKALGMSVRGYTPSEEDEALVEGRAARKAQAEKAKGEQPIRARETDAPATAAPAAAPKAPAQPVADSSAPPAPAGRPAAERDINRERADAFATKTPAAAAKQFPELAGAAAAVTAMEKQAEADGLTPAQRAVVAARVRQNVVNAIERGDLPEVKMNQTMQREPERQAPGRTADKEQTR